MPEQARIEFIWAFVAVDKHDDEEGVCGAQIGPGGSWLPLIASDRARLDLLLPIARVIAQRTGQTIKLIKLTHREEVMEITGSLQ